MGQDLNKMMSVFIDGIEEVRVVAGFVHYGPHGDIVPVPVLKDGEYYFISEMGIQLLSLKTICFLLRGFARGCYEKICFIRRIRFCRTKAYESNSGRWW